jgi:hypothetical protein
MIARKDQRRKRRARIKPPDSNAVRGCRSLARDVWRRFAGGMRGVLRCRPAHVTCHDHHHGQCREEGERADEQRKRFHAENYIKKQNNPAKIAAKMIAKRRACHRQGEERGLSEYQGAAYRVGGVKPSGSENEIKSNPNNVIDSPSSPYCTI